MRAGRAALVAAVAVVAVALAGCGGSGGRRAAPAPTSAAPTVTVTADVPTSGPPPTAAPVTTMSTPVPQATGPARVKVAVATVWTSPSAPRRIDAPALADPVDIRGWLASMSVPDRRDLQGRAETQALLGDQVQVIGTQGEWAHVVVPDQPTRKDPRGYPGWVPLRQLTFTAPADSPRQATVTVPLTRLLDPATGAQGMEVSFGTRLPVDPADDTGTGPVGVVLPGGGRARLPRQAVTLTAPGAPALAATGPSLVAAARSFEGTPYLWAGVSGFAFDCSGLAHLDYRVHGVRIPRDAEDQALAGQPAPRRATAPGDLFFYARNGTVHHVAMVVDSHTLVQAPAAGEVVQVVSPDTPPRPAEFSGARRYLG